MRFGGDPFARDDAVAGEQLLRDGRGPFGGVGRGRSGSHERPPSFGRRRRQAPRSERAGLVTPAPGSSGRTVARRARAGERAQRMERVVGHEPLPGEIPQRVDGLRRIAAAGRFVQRTEKRRAVRSAGIRGFSSRARRGPARGCRPDRTCDARTRPARGRRQAVATGSAFRRIGASGGNSCGRCSARYSATRPSRSPIGSTPTQTTSPAAVTASRSAGIVDLDPRRQDLGLENRRGQRRALQLLDRVEQRIGAVPPLHHAVPRRHEAAEHRVIDRLDLVAELGERAAPQHAQHAGVGPFPLGAARAELALDQAPFGRSAGSAPLRRPPDRARIARRTARR